MLEDGDYDIFVVDAEDVGAAIRLDLTVLAGAHRGEMVTVTASGLGTDAIDLLGTPGTLTVTDGQPVVHLEP